MKRFIMGGAAMAIMAAAGCVSPNVSGMDGIAEANTRFEAAFNAGDSAALAALYTPDAVVMAPNLTRLVGREAIRGLWQSFFDAGVSDLDLNTIDLTIAGSRASEVGTLSLTSPDGKGGRVTAHAKYIVLWQQLGGGEWRLHRDIWNNDPAG
jgi:uncharacterized protein (TIGR02246 family)